MNSTLRTSAESWSIFPSIRCNVSPCWLTVVFRSCTPSRAFDTLASVPFFHVAAVQVEAMQNPMTAIRTVTLVRTERVSSSWTKRVPMSF